MQRKTEQETGGAAAGNGSSYPQNISAHKEQQQQQVENINGRKANNNKTKIKISLYTIKRKTSHFKCFIGFYLNFILCISQINNYIIRCLEAATSCKISPYCIINLQLQLQPQQQQPREEQPIQHLQTKAIYQHLKAISFQFNRVINLFIKHIKLTKSPKRIKHFIGICLKRLITLKRLQPEIPANRATTTETSCPIHINDSSNKALQLSTAQTRPTANLPQNHKFEKNCQFSLDLPDKDNRKNVKEKWDDKEAPKSCGLQQPLHHKITEKMDQTKEDRQEYIHEHLQNATSCTNTKQTQLEQVSGKCRNCNRNLTISPVFPIWAEKWAQLKLLWPILNDNHTGIATGLKNATALHALIAIRVLGKEPHFLCQCCQQNQHKDVGEHSEARKQSNAVVLRYEYQGSLEDHKENCTELALDSPPKCGPLRRCNTERRHIVVTYLVKNVQEALRKNHHQIIQLTELRGLLKKQPVVLCHYNHIEQATRQHWRHSPLATVLKIAPILNNSSSESRNASALSVCKQQTNAIIFVFHVKKLEQSKQNPATEVQSLISTASKSQQYTCRPKSSNKSTPPVDTCLKCFPREKKRQLADNKNTARRCLLSDKNNSCQVENKQRKCPKKCQHVLYSIFIYYCAFCYWNIYGFPLVLLSIFKYLKDATVHVLTRRLSAAKTATATIATTAVYHKHESNIKAVWDGGFKEPESVACCKANPENVSKRQTHTTTNIPCVLTTSCCLTTSLTASLSYRKSLGNLIILQRQSQQPRMSYSHYQQYRRHRHHHHHRYDHYQYLHKLHYYYQHHHRQKQEKHLLPQLQQHQQEQHQQLYNFSSTIHLQLPSLLVVSRTLIILILLSSLWHTSEGFHASGVKLSTNMVKTKYGLVRGIVVRSSPSLVEAYLGIPYASPPVGSLRFMPPITPSAWKTVRNADRFSPVCPQNVPIPPNGPEALLEVPRARLAQLRRLLPLLSNQSEDCLYLNIYVPHESRRHRRFTATSAEQTDSLKLPTVLFIHGESYEWNSGNPYDGSELAAHGNVIVVTINFRLGILGFLKTGGKESAQGNFGLMDLVAGLHWLKENLDAFGGDPQQITLLGHGTGAALANILVVSPVANDLVQHIVMVSGSALSPWAIQKNPLFVKRRVAEQTGCHGDMLYYDLAPCLRTKSLAELLAVKIDHPRFLVGFAPFIDGTVISPNTDSIGKLSLPLGSAIVSTSGIEYANFPKRNLIFCLTSVESHLDLNAQDLEFGFNETRRDRILRTFVRNNFHYHLNEIFAVLKNEYTEWDKAIRSPLSSRDATLQFLSDGHTASSLIKLGYMHSLRGGRAYFMHFKHRTIEEEYPQRTGSVRGEDVPFWLGLPISPLFPHNYTTQEKQISRLMLRYLANFAKTGNPNQSSASSPTPSSSSLIGSSSLSMTSTLSSLRGPATDDALGKAKRSSLNIANAAPSTSSGPIRSTNIVEDRTTAAAREALSLAVLYNQHRTKRTYYKRHSRSNDDHSGSSDSNEMNYFLNANANTNTNNLDSDELPFWDAYDVVNQLYMELGNKAEIQSHYRGHKLSMWLNLIPQLHRHANINDQSMRHHQFQDDLNNLNLYEGIVRAQIQTKPDDDEDNVLLPKGRPTPQPPAQDSNTTQKAQVGTTECGVDGAMFVAEMTTILPADNHSLVLDSREKEMATASTGMIGNLEVLRRLSGKQFQSYTTALVATVAVGCFLLVLNILIFAGIYHQREKRARDAKTKEELQDNDTSKNSSMLKLNAVGSETGSFNGSSAGVSGKTTVVFGEYNCYDEKSLQTKDEKLIVELPPSQMLDSNWAACSTSTLDLLKTKHHAQLDTSYTVSNIVPIKLEAPAEHLVAVNNLEMATYTPLPIVSGLLIDPVFVPTSSAGVASKRGSFLGSSGQLNQYDFASVQSSDQMSFKDIENAVKASAAMNDDITQDDDIPEPPPPPRSFQSLQQQQQQHTQAATSASTSASGSGGGGGGILRQAGTASAAHPGGSKKRVHIQEISV